MSRAQPASHSLLQRILQEAALERATKGCTCPPPWSGGLNAHAPDCPSRT